LHELMIHDSNTFSNIHFRYRRQTPVRPSQTRGRNYPTVSIPKQCRNQKWSPHQQKRSLDLLMPSILSTTNFIYIVRVNDSYAMTHIVCVIERLTKMHQMDFDHLSLEVSVRHDRQYLLWLHQQSCRLTLQRFHRKFLQLNSQHRFLILC